MSDQINLNNREITDNEKKKGTRGPSFKKLEKMDYLEILDNYLEYPSKNLKFTVNRLDGSKDKIKFLSEEDKAYGWIQNHSRSKKASKFLQTNLHYLPEHLWDDLVPFVDKTANSVVGYKVKDQNINYFVHKADSDSYSEELYNEINMKKLGRNKGYFDEESLENISRLNSYLIDKGIDSWLTLRATKILEGPEKWNAASTHYITKDYISN